MESFRFRDRPSASGYVGRVIYISDVGQGGSFWTSNGAFWNAVGGEYILKSEASDIVSDGTTTETVLSQVAVPAGLLQVGDFVELDYLVEKSATTDVSTNRTRMGVAGTIADVLVVSLAQPGAANRLLRQHIQIRINSSTSAQSVVTPGASTYGVSTTPTSSVGGTINFTVDNFISFCSSMTTGGIETLTIKKLTYKHITARV